MKRLVALLTLAMLLAASAPAYAFHHVQLPSTSCAADAAGSPSNDNGEAKEALTGQAGLTLPLPPVGTPGMAALSEGPAHDVCANAE